MAYKWSWAFGPESAADLETISGLWDTTNQSVANNAPSNTIRHTYVGDTSDRYSMGVRGGTQLKTTRQVLAGSGWFSAYFYYDGASDWSVRDFLEIYGPNSGNSIEIFSQTGRSLALRFAGGGTTFTPSSSLNLADKTWHHIGVKYDMRTDNHWGAEIFINGVSRISGSRTENALDAESSADVWLGGVNDSSVLFLHWSDLVAYDNLSDSSPYGQYVSRIQPYADISDNGSWTPSSTPFPPPGTQASNLDGAIAVTPVVEEASPTTGEFIQVQSQPLSVNIGLSSFNSYGFSAHLFASGSSTINLIAKTSADPPSVFAEGDPVIDGENAYAYASSASIVLVDSDTINFRAEVG